MVAEKALDAWEKSLPPPKPTRRCPSPDQISGEHGFAAGEAVMAVEHPEIGSGWSFGVSRTDQCTLHSATRGLNLVQCESSPGMSE